MKSAQLAAVARFAITFAAGILVAKGRIEAPSAEQIDTMAGAVAGVLGAVSLGWSLFHKQKVEKAIDVALDMPAGSTKADLKKTLDRE